jgi:hypothetical protein
MRLTLDRQEPQARVGGLRGLVRMQGDLISPTTEPRDWNPSL